MTRRRPTEERSQSAVETPMGFMTRLKPENGGPANPTRAVVSYLPKGATSLPASSFSLKYLVDGEEIYRGADSSRSVRSGQILIAPSGQNLEVELRRPSAGLCLYFDVPHASFCLIPTLRLNAAEFALGRAVAELADVAMRSGDDVDGQVERFLVETKRSVEVMIDDLEGAARRVGGVRAETRRQRLEKITLGRMYLESHAHRPVSLEEAASAAGMSVFHFARQFAHVFGETPAAFHEGLRLELACAHLRGGLSASRVAKELGYSDLSVFSRAFSRRYGLPPSRLASSP
ncbi:AraC family transcriptional regulator [Roseibacterium beibuensis]|uniref:AraC family transcriptional regulator n=1 Tax=[Roseibacterium] beibuensis TaxID=1193142 RepID=UPI00217E2DC0|nr:AraC family transcriptional regulator [Roseibacterium beibuensis]MCS6625423.1 AraC family transcriptional regulator [Roseibacterium beibuensis]